jgi:hypothetical protein
LKVKSEECRRYVSVEVQNAQDAVGESRGRVVKLGDGDAAPLKDNSSPSYNQSHHSFKYSIHKHLKKP